MPRLDTFSVRMSSICFSWRSDLASSVTVYSFSSYFAPVPLKSKRWLTSRFAWSTALVSSWGSISDTTSKEGMADLRTMDRRQRERGILTPPMQADSHVSQAHFTAA